MQKAYLVWAYSIDAIDDFDWLVAVLLDKKAEKYVIDVTEEQKNIIENRLPDTMKLDRNWWGHHIKYCIVEYDIVE